MTKVDQVERKKIDYHSILLFYVVALAIRFLAIYVLPTHINGFDRTLWGQLLSGAGPCLGALLVMAVFRKRLFFSVFGLSVAKSLLCLALPVVLLVAVDWSNGLQFSVLFLACIIYAFLEEVGWRGYLLGEFSSLKQWKRVVIITVFWFLWHMDAPHLTNIVFLLIILLSTWGLDQIAVDSHSLIFCSCLHGSFNLLKRGNDNNIFNDTSATVIFILTVVGWFLIWYVIRKKSINK